MLPHIEDAFRAARHDAERDWPGDDRPTRAEAARDDDRPDDRPEPCTCGQCLMCKVIESRSRR